MSKYKVIISGEEYEVEVEAIDESEIKPVKKELTADVATSKKPGEIKAPVLPSDGEQVTAPIPGTILEFKVADKDKVKAGQVIMILEAMKMENEIVAPIDGRVSFCVSKGTTVIAGDLLCTIA